MVTSARYFAYWSKCRIPIAALLAAAVAAAAVPASAGLPDRSPRLPGAGSRTRAAPFAPTLLPSTAGSPVDCVIVAPDSLADVFQRLADYQTRIGRPTVVRALSTIRGADPRSNDLAQAIRSFLRAARDQWGIRWAILAGDNDAIPMRVVHVEFAEPLDIPSDAYYADLDGTWDANGNGVYGEVADSLDMEPDIAVGRLSAESRADATTLVDKALRYATAPFVSNVERQLTLAEVLSPSNWKPGDLVQVDGAIEAESLRVHLPSCQTDDRYYENWTRYPGSQTVDKPIAMAALSRGYNVVYQIGHGSRSQIAVGPDVITVADIPAIQNGDSCALWISQNCASAAVDYDSFAERLVRQPHGGALAYVGATRDAWPGVSAALSLALQSELFGPAERTLGEAVENARASLLPAARSETQERWGYFETVLLGVPSLPMYRCAPDTLVVTRPSSVPLDAGGFLVTVTSGGAPAESALVVAWKAGEDYQAVFTDAAGQAAVPFHPGSTGAFSLAVTRPNVIPFLDTLTVAATAPAHLDLTAASADDAHGGDGDGLIGTGESFAIAGTLKNSGGTATAGPVSIQASPLTAGIIVDQPAAVIAALAPGAAAALPDSLRIRALSAPNASRVERVRLAATDGVRADTFVVDVSVTAPSILATRSIYQDGNDGVLGPGDDFSMSWFLGNEGDGAATALTIAARNPAPGIVPVDSTGIASQIPPGVARTTPPLTFHCVSVPAGRLFDLAISDARGHSWTIPVDGAPPPAPSGLRVVGSDVDRITLGWGGVPASDLLGYLVIRATDTTGTVSQVTPLPTRRTPSFEDDGLAPLGRYWYAVIAVDSSGNRSAPSPFFLASTTPPALAGFPASTGVATSSSVCLADLEGDGRPEILVGADYLYAFRADGTDWIDGDGNPVTTGIFSTLLHHIPSTPAAADLDGDGAPEIIAASWDDSLVAAFHANGSLVAGWPKKGAAPFWSAPAIGDLDGDGSPEIVVGSNTNLVYAWHANGTEVRDGDSNPATDGVYFVPSGTVISSPAIADLDGDGTREVIFGTSAGRVYAIDPGGPLAGWPTSPLGGAVSASPAIGDIVPGAGLEVATGCANDSVYVFTATGQRAPGWPRPLELTPGNGRVNSPALAPLRKHLGDPSLDVVICGADGRLVAFDPTGAVLPGWGNVRLGGPTEASPSVADLDGDGSLEVLIGAEDRRLYAFHYDGTPVSGFPIAIDGEVRSTPAVWDLKGEGVADIVVSGWDGAVHAWRYPGTFLTSGMAWPMFRHDSWHTGLATFPILTSADPPPAPPSPPAAPPARATLAQNRPNPFNPVTWIGYTVPGTKPVPVHLRIYTVNGRLVRTLVSRPIDPGYHEALWDGRGDRGEPLASGVYLCRAEIGATTLTRKMALLR